MSESISQKKNLTLESGTNLDSAMGPITPQHAIDYKNDFSNNLGCLQSQNELECLQVRHFKKFILEGIQQVCGPNFAHFHKIFHKFCRISIFFFKTLVSLSLLISFDKFWFFLILFVPISSNLIKASKFQKQIFLFSFEPKNEQNYFLFSALASKNDDFFWFDLF